MIRSFLALLVYIFCVTEVQSQSEWRQQDCPVTADLHNAFFVSDSVGWIITHKTGTVLHTTNGGNSWFIQSQLDSIFLESIYFLDPKIGWISGQHGLIFKTTDGGENWKKEKLSESDTWIYSVYFMDKNKGLAVGLHEGTRPFAPVFLSTNDGGTNWINLVTDVPRTGYEPIFFIDSNQGFVAGGGYILHTDDGGNNWEIQYADTPKYCRTIRGLFFINFHIGFAVGACGLVLKTENKGKNWRRVEKFTNNDLRSVAFVDESKGLIVGEGNREQGVLFTTNNGGETWQTVQNDYPDLHRVKLSQNRIWIVGKEGTILTKSK